MSELYAAIENLYVSPTLGNYQKCIDLITSPPAEGFDGLWDVLTESGDNDLPGSAKESARLWYTAGTQDKLKDAMIEVLAEQLTVVVIPYEDDQRWERMTDTELNRRERAAWIGQAKAEVLKRLEVQGE